MFGELLSEFDADQKIKIVKYAAVFAGGVLAGYSIKKVLDSYDLDVIKNNAVDMIEDYVNPKKEYVDIVVEDVVVEENTDI